MPASTSQQQKEKLIGVLTKLQADLAAANPYVKDFLTAAEVFKSEKTVDGEFVIDADARPADAHKGQYDGGSGRRYRFSEVCVLAAEVPRATRSVVVRHRGDGKYKWNGGKHACVVTRVSHSSRGAL